MMPASLIPGVSRGVHIALDFALTNIGVCEDPPGSNRGPEIDAWAAEFGSPPGSYWCALAVAKARRQGGLWIPERDAGACDEWLLAGRRTDLFTSAPEPGAAVLYTNHHLLRGGRYDGQPDVVHIGLVLRIEPVLVAIEGNTTLGRYDRNGFIQTLKAVDTARVLGYIRPVTREAT